MKSLLVCILLALSTPAFAKGGCDTLAEYAGMTMEARQLGVEEHTIMMTTLGGDYQWGVVLRDIIDSAYKSPIYPHKEAKQVAVTVFRGEIRFLCNIAIDEPL